jgi:hypothetical protein
MRQIVEEDGDKAIEDPAGSEISSWGKVNPLRSPPDFEQPRNFQEPLFGDIGLILSLTHNLNCCGRSEALSHPFARSLN